MLLTLKWMDNLQYTQHHHIMCDLFFIFNLTCYKFVTLKENTLTHSFQNHFSKQTNHPLRVFFIERSGCPTKGRNWREVSLQTQKFEIYPSIDITPTKKWSPHVSLLIKDQILEKSICNSFWRILPKILPAPRIFSYTIVIYISATKQSGQILQKQDGYIKTVCSPGHPENGFVPSQALGYMMYICEVH